MLWHTLVCRNKVHSNKVLQHSSHSHNARQFTKAMGISEHSRAVPLPTTASTFHREALLHSVSDNEGSALCTIIWLSRWQVSTGTPPRALLHVTGNRQRSEQCFASGTDHFTDAPWQRIFSAMLLDSIEASNNIAITSCWRKLSNEAGCERCLKCAVGRTRMVSFHSMCLIKWPWTMT